MSTKQKKLVEEQPFDIQKYLISTELETRVLLIPETGDEVEIQLKPIPWSKRNKIISVGDRYVKTCLTQMIAHAPWGITDEKFLSSIDARLGTVLENLVPKAFGDDQTQAAATLKKD